MKYTPVNNIGEHIRRYCPSCQLERPYELRKKMDRGEYIEFSYFCSKCTDGKEVFVIKLHRPTEGREPQRCYDYALQLALELTGKETQEQLLRDALDWAKAHQAQENLECMMAQEILRQLKDKRLVR